MDLRVVTPPSPIVYYSALLSLDCVAPSPPGQQGIPTKLVRDQAQEGGTCQLLLTSDPGVGRTPQPLLPGSSQGLQGVLVSAKDSSSGVSCQAIGGQVWGSPQSQAKPGVQSQEICLGNQVKGPGGQTEHKVSWTS